MLPLKKAPSSITTLALLISPTSRASLRMSIFSVTSMFPFTRPKHDDFASLDIRGHFAVRSHGEPAFLQLDGAFHFAVNRKVLAAENLALYQ